MEFHKKLQQRWTFRIRIRRENKANYSSEIFYDLWETAGSLSVFHTHNIPNSHSQDDKENYSFSLTTYSEVIKKFDFGREVFRFFHTHTVPNSHSWMTKRTKVLILLFNPFPLIHILFSSSLVAQDHNSKSREKIISIGEWKLLGFSQA